MTQIPPAHERDDEDGIRDVLSRYGFSSAACQITRPDTARGFSGALVLRIDAEDGGAYCLRRWPRDGLPMRRLLGLHRFLRALQDAEISQIAAPLTTRTGATLVEHAEAMWQMEPWMPGCADFHRHPSPPRLESALQTLARIHRAAERYRCPAVDHTWFGSQAAARSPACQERLSMIRRWSSTRCAAVDLQLAAAPASSFTQTAGDILRLFEIARSPVEQELLLLRGIDFPLHPCLRDIWHDHLLFTGDVLSGVIDASAARMENVASDLSRLLGSLLGDDLPRWDSALAAYDCLRPMSGNERRLIAALDRSSVLLSGLTWIDRWLSGKVSDDEVPRVLPRLRSISERLTRLVSSLS